MQVSVENVGKLGRKLTVRLPADALEDKVRARMREVGQSVRLKGFRPGKVPPKVLEQRFGSQIRSEALSEIIGSTFQEAVDREKLRPAAQPSIATSGRPENGEIEYTATFEVLPEIGPIDVAGLEIVKPVASVADSDVEDMIQTLRHQRRSWSEVARAATDGDMVFFEYSAESGDVRHPESGTDAIGTVIGSNALFAEFEQALAGHAAGESFETDLAFPAKSHVPALSGKTAQVAIKVVRVQEPKLPEVDDAFVASFGVREGGIEQFRRDVRANLERELDNTLSARLKAATVEKLLARHPDLEIPQSLIENDARVLARQADPKNPDKYEAFLGAARNRVAAGLLLAELARQNGIVVDAQRVSRILASIASTYEEPAEVIEMYNRDPQLMGSLRSRVLEDQVIDWIAEHAEASEQPLSFGEVMRPGA